ncbi:WD40-repeat-containing domain protein [Mycena olivaceomarginata]|nr:WD40-repeat-containing domain protein [Mycena olivaceomarginata]
MHSSLQSRDSPSSAALAERAPGAPPLSHLLDRSISLRRMNPPKTNYGLLSSLTKPPILDLYGTELGVTGAEDGLVPVWDGGEDGGKVPVAEFDVGCPVTAVCWSADGASVYAAALDNEIHIHDLRKPTQFSTLSGHTDTPTSLALSPTGAFLLSPSLSSQTPIHDVRRVAVGGADRIVCVWDVESGRVVYKRPGHKGTVTSVDWHPKEPIILTGSKDGTTLLGELEAGLRV